MRYQTRMGLLSDDSLQVKGAFQYLFSLLNLFSNYNYITIIIRIIVVCYDLYCKKLVFRYYCIAIIIFSIGLFILFQFV